MKGRGVELDTLKDVKPETEETRFAILLPPAYSGDSSMLHQIFSIDEVMANLRSVAMFRCY